MLLMTEVKIPMGDKPLHYDGSLHNLAANQSETITEPFVITDEIRKNLSGNPFINEKTE